MIIPPTTEQLHAMSTAPRRYWLNHTNPPAEPAQQETTMGNVNETTCFTGGYAGNAVCATDAPAQSPVMQAINDLQQQIGECAFRTDDLLDGIGAVLRGEPAEEGSRVNTVARPMMASDLAEMIQVAADNVRAIRVRIAGAHERLTL